MAYNCLSVKLHICVLKEIFCLNPHLKIRIRTVNLHFLYLDILKTEIGLRGNDKGVIYIDNYALFIYIYLCIIRIKLIIYLFLIYSEFIHSKFSQFGELKNDGQTFSTH